MLKQVLQQICCRTRPGRHFSRPGLYQFIRFLRIFAAFWCGHFSQSGYFAQLSIRPATAILGDSCASIDTSGSIPVRIALPMPIIEGRRPSVAGNLSGPGRLADYSDTFDARSADYSGLRDARLHTRRVRAGHRVRRLCAKQQPHVDLPQQRRPGKAKVPWREMASKLPFAPVRQPRSTGDTDARCGRWDRSRCAFSTSYCWSSRCPWP